VIGLNRIYNKEAINRIASEDRLDKMIVLASPGIWFSIIGSFLIIGALLIWGFNGAVPTTVDANGIFTHKEGTMDIYAKQDGFVLSVYAREGDEVAEGDLIASLGTEDEMFELRQMDTRIQYVENMTLESEMDIVSPDTEEMAQLKISYNNSGQDAVNKKAELELKQEKLDNLAQEVRDKEETMLTFKEQYFATLNVVDDQNQLKYNEANSDYDTHFSEYEQAKNTYISSKEHYYQIEENFNEKYADYDSTEHTDEENDAFYAAMADVESARSEAADYEEFMKREEAKLNEANDKLNKARKEYLEYINAQSGVAASNTVASTEYTEALNDYNTAKNQYKSLMDEVDDLRLQVIMSEGSKEDDSEKYKQQFQNAKSAKLIDLRAQRDSILNSASKGEIRSQVNGRIYDMNLYTGLAVAKGSVMASLLAGNDSESDLVCYVPLADVRRIKKGMDIYVYPSTVKKEEYGHIIGTVSDVSNHVETDEDMKTQLGADSVVADFSKKGPVVAVKCSLKEDGSTVSGYEWSSEKGADVPLETNTIMYVTFITENKKPINLLIPYLREKLDFKADSEEGAS